MKMDPFWQINFLLFGVLTIILTLYVNSVLKNNGFKGSFSLNQWGQLVKLIKSKKLKSQKWKYTILLALIVLSTVLTVIAFLKS